LIDLFIYSLIDCR